MDWITYTIQCIELLSTVFTRLEFANLAMWFILFLLVDRKLIYFLVAFFFGASVLVISRLWGR